MQPPDLAARARPTNADRALAALAYVGPGWAVALLLAPPRRFVLRHSLLATTLHLTRCVACALVVLLWLLAHRDAGPLTAPLALQFGSLLVFGVPWIGLSAQLLLALALPLGGLWLLCLAGALAAASGHTLDLHGLLHGDWSDPLPAESNPTTSRWDDPRQARELTEQRLNRIWRASRQAAMERQRVERMRWIRGEQDVVLGQLDNLNHMLSLGELSMTRFNALHSELIAYLTELRQELLELEQRRAERDSTLDPSRRPTALGALPDVRVLSLAVVDASGMPVRTYGYFPLDESIITGMVAAFESLSAEMFGSHVHKTQLSGGQVVHFARGQALVAYAVFEDDPSPSQIAGLRDFLLTFEETNRAALRILPVDPSRLREVPAPFAVATPA
ncbi:MAG TPA: hypothetical protein VFI42_10770 [Thermomicrobiaceae bacterium]|nr:hypothetical protein [Thermomicrobiaceae bacterium]